jgi:serine/threonine protein kinase
MSPTQLHIVLYGTAQAHAFLHARGLRHGGVGPDNIFFDEKLEPHLDECVRKQTAAPELDDDVWSFGMTVC